MTASVAGIGVGSLGEHATFAYSASKAAALHLTRNLAVELAPQGILCNSIAPGFFPTVWGWIKRWFDPVTTSKIFILSAAEVTPTLTSFMELSSIPKQYGGELEWQWGEMPHLDEPAQELLKGLEQEPAEGQTRKPLMKGPVLFKGDVIEVLGTEDGKDRRATRHQRLQRNRLSPRKPSSKTRSPRING